MAGEDAGEEASHTAAADSDTRHRRRQSQDNHRWCDGEFNHAGTGEPVRFTEYVGFHISEVLIIHKKT